MRILVAGSGAVGGYFGAWLARAGEDVFFLARGRQLAAMRERGLDIRGKRGAFRVAVRAGERPEGTAEFVLAAVKAYDNAAVAEVIAPAVGPETRICSLQNGIGNEEFFASRFGAERILGGVAYVGAEVVEPGVIVQETGGRVVIGDFPRGVTEPARRLAAVFERADVPCDLSEDIVRDLWEKLVANAVFNSLQTVHNCTLGELLEGEKRREAQSAIDEIAAVTKALGITLRPEALTNPWVFCERYPTFRSSTQQDLLRGKPLEADVLNGAVIEAGRRAAVPTPTHERIYEQLKALGNRARSG